VVPNTPIHSPFPPQVSWKAKLLQIHADRWEYLHSDFHAAAYALDPEFIDTAGKLDGPTQTGLMNVIKKLSLRDALLAAPDRDAAMLTLNLQSPEVFEREAQAHRELAIYQKNEGIFTERAVLFNAKDLEPSAWWMLYGKHLPLLCSFAQCILSQPAAASAAERNWSIYGSIQSERRTRMGHVVADKLVYCHEAIHLAAKLQDAGYENKPADWDDSDSDSNASRDDDSGSAAILALMA